jgi:hypothetical protein
VKTEGRLTQEEDTIMKLSEKVYNGFVKVFGDIKVFKFPLFAVYDPGGYKVKGEDIREVIQKLRPGDILIRGYENYLDGYFIPGFFSHAGLYLGKVGEDENELVERGAEKSFKTGDQMVIHSMAEGVFMEDVINFCRCDSMVVLRRNPDLESEAGKRVSFREVLAAALSHLGDDYDFRFDFEDFHALSCTELVYVCCKGFIEDYGVTVKERTVLFAKKKMILPDDLVSSRLEVAWKSKSISDERMKRIRPGWQPIP